MMVTIFISIFQKNIYRIKTIRSCSLNVKLMKCGGLDRALQVIHRAREIGMRVMLGSMSESSLGCGAMARLIEEATEFAKTRVVSGEVIANYQLIQAMLADSVVDLQAARLMTYEAAAAHDRGDDLKALHARCSMAKLFASEAAYRVADRAVQIFGGRGYMRENVAERFLREIRVDRIWEGTSEIQRLIIARSLLKRGLEATAGNN